MGRWTRAAIALCLCAGFALCGVSRADEGTDSLQVKVFEMPRPGSENVYDRAQRAIVDSFLAKSENTNTDLVSFAGLKAPGTTGDVGPLMAIAAGIAPDVLYVNFNKSGSYIHEAFLRPLDQYIIAQSQKEGIPIDPENPFSDDELPKILRGRVPEPAWPVIYRPGPDGEKHVWAIPYNTVIMTLMYRKDLFLQAGLDPDVPPATWDEFFEAAKRIHDPRRGVYGVGLSGGVFSSHSFMSFLWSSGAEAMVQNDKGEWVCAFDSDEAVLAFDFYRKLVTTPIEIGGSVYEGVVTRDQDKDTKWKQGRVGMFFGYLNAQILAEVNPEQVGIGPVPRGPGGESSSELNCRMMGLSATTTDPEILQKAFDFIWYFDSSEARQIATDVYVKNGYGRFANPQWLQDFGYTEYIRQVPKTWVEAFKNATQNGTPEPYARNAETFYREVSIPLERIVATDYSGLSDDQRHASIKATLERAVADSNRKMLGRIAPEEQQFRKRVALVVAAVILAVFSVMFAIIYRDFTPDWSKGMGWAFSRYKWAYILLIPAVLSVVLWKYVPLGRGAMIAFQDYRILRETTFVGLDNFAEILFDPSFWKYLWNSTYYMLLFFSVCFWPPILLAILLQEVPRGKILFRVLFYLPALTSGLVIAFLWKSFFEPSDAGLLNQLVQVADQAPAWIAATIPGLSWVGGLQVGQQKWLEDPSLAMMCIMLPQLWATMGPGCIIYLAALKSIPNDFYEAAELDGAGFAGKVRHIVIPYLKPLIVINFVGAFIAAFQSAEYVFVMTGGGPAEATHVLGYEIFVRSFIYLKFGIGTAMAWVLGTLLIGFTAYQLRILSRLQFKTAGTDEGKA